MTGDDNLDGQVLLEKCRAIGNLICYGAGTYAEFVTIFLEMNGVHIDSYCISNKSKMGKSFMGREVRSISEIINDTEYGIVVCVSSTYRDEIKKTLHDKGVFSAIYVTDEFVRALMNDRECRKRHLLYDILYHEHGKKLYEYNAEFEEKISR